LIINHCLYGIIRLILILSLRPGLSWMVTVPLTWTCTILYGPLALLPNFFRPPLFLKHQLLWSLILAPSFLVFSHEVLMDEMFSSLCDGMPICNQWNVEKHVSVKHNCLGCCLRWSVLLLAWCAWLSMIFHIYSYFCICNLSPYMLYIYFVLATCPHIHGNVSPCI
jgi:hypothetical protein